MSQPEAVTRLILSAVEAIQPQPAVSE
jgi:hypothetical protein